MPAALGWPHLSAQYKYPTPSEQHCSRQEHLLPEHSMPAPAEIFNGIEISPPIPPLINIHLDPLLRAGRLLGYALLLDFVFSTFAQKVQLS